MRSATLVLVLGLAPAMPAAAEDGFAPPKVETYEVTGANVSAILADVKKKGPRGFAAMSSYSWDYRPEIESTTAGFRIRSVTLTLHQTITMPAWKDYDAASRCMKDSWDAMLKNLRRHEDLHLALARVVGDEMRTAFIKIPPQPSVSQLAKLVHSSARRISNSNKVAQDRFDELTQHGIKDEDAPVLFRNCGR